MCRMAAITADNLPVNLTAYLLDFMMARHVSDEGQMDGHGISMMDEIVHRSPDPYWSTPPDWMLRYKEMDNRIVMGHVRKASAQTDKYNSLAPHPYMYITRADTRMVLQHNGWIEGTPKHNWNSGFPNTDSFRAGFTLLELINREIDAGNGADLTNELLVEWTETFYRGSLYVFFILYGGELIVVRGNMSRTMFINEVGNGYMLATSRAVLDATTARVSHFGVEVGSVARFIPEHSISRISEGVHDLRIHNFVPRYRDWHVVAKDTKHPNAVAPANTSGGTAASGNTATYFGAAASSVASVEVFDEGTAVGTAMVVRAASRTDRLREIVRNMEDVGLAAYDGDGEEDELHRWDDRRERPRPRRQQHSKRSHAATNSVEEEVRKAVFTQIREKLNPMRAASILFWLADTFGILKSTGDVDFNAALDLPAGELQDFIEYVAPTQIKGIPDKNGEIFSKQQKQLINLFNKMVPPHRDRELVVRFHRMFGYYWTYTETGLDTVLQYLKHLMDTPVVLGDDPFLLDDAVDKPKDQVNLAKTA